ncbi:MAG: filamentous hemagglutinin N-terminal domain-containing protein, partial [Phycisphaerales bacterium]|nr:filamentous hemagglutinin N-terminal domain-containing protein [Phycisphaerales bacterium]
MSVQTRRNQAARTGGLFSLALAVGLMTGQATATPQGAQVVNGNVVISQNGQYMIIQASDGSIINFSSFNIWNGQTVQFIQPGEFARVLNRITGPDPSMINGTLLANGTVYISNPAGIYFGHGALVDVGGIYAAAGTITDNKFLNHIDRFREVTGSVVNHGEIRASHAAHLIGQYVKNTGIVRADQGVITMIAGNDILISEVGGHVHVKVDGHQLLHNGPLAGSSTPTIIGQAGVENTGSVIADGGQIILGAGDMYGLALRNSGLLRASGGEIHLAAADGAIHNTVDGTIKVSVDNGLAGDITIHAPSIVNQGRIRADADFGHAGTIEITSQNHTHLIDGSTITAQGRGNAKGGDILIHSYNGVTYVSSNSTIDFSGGASGGAGGFAEVSGKELGLHGTIRMAGGGGAADGELLIDPIGIKVWNYTPGVGDPDPGLGDNEVLFNDFPNTVLSIAYSSLADLVGTITLQAEQTIIFGNSVAGDTLTFTNAPDLVLEAGKHINFKGSIVGLGSLTASADVAFTGLPSDGIGSIRLFEDWAGSTLEATGAVEFNSPQRIQIFRNITADTIALNSDVFVGGPITLTAATSITTSSGINTQGGVVPNALVLNAPDVEVAGSIGDVNALGSLDVSGTTFAFGGDGIVTEGGQTYATNVELAQDTTFTSQGSADITFDGTLAAQAGFDDADVQVNTGGTTTFNGDVTLASLETDAGGTAEFGGGVAVTTTGDQTYNDTVDAGEAANFATFTSSGGSISFLSDATVRGHVDADQDVLFDGLATVSGNVMAGNDATFNGDATFDGDASQTVSAGGAVQFNAAASKTVGDAGNGLTVEGDSITFAEGVDSQGFLTVNGDYTVAGDVAAEFDIDLNGSGTFNGDDVNQAITSTNGSIETGDLDKTGEGNLTVEVLDNTQTILVDGTIDVADGSLNVLNNGGTLEVTGDVNTSDASTFDGVSTIGGDITSSQVTFTDDAFFGSNEEGGGLTQVVTATSGIIDAQGNVTASNGLTFNANGNVQVAGDVDVQNGTFTVASTNGDAMMGGDITASDDIIFDDTDLVLTEEGDQTITAGNDIAFGGDVTKADGSLAIIADNTVADGRIDILDGDLTVDSDLTLNHNAGNNGFSVRTSGTQTYNGLLTLGANTRLRTTGAGGDIMITSGVAGAGRNLDVDAAGLATLLGDIAVADLDVAGGGGIDLDAIIDASGSVDFADQVNLLGNSTIEGQSVRFRDAVGGNARLLIRNADLIRLDGDVTVDDLRLKNSGTAIIKGVVTTTGDVLITNVDVVTLDEVNAGARLRVTGGSSATFNGDLDADSIVADATDGLLFEGSRSVTANGNIDLNRLGRDAPADVATVASTGDL